MLKLNQERSKKVETSKNNHGIIVFLIFFILLSLALGGYIFYDKFYQKENANPTESQPIEKEEPKEELVNKINNSKYWIYDADYEKDVLSDFYNVGSIYKYVDDIKVPFINIDSSYAYKANQEIKKVFDKAIDAYNEGVQNELTWVDIDYQKYIDIDMVSTALWYSIKATGVVNPNYFTYNIDLKTGEEMSFDEVYQKCGFTKDNIDNKVKENITSIMKDRLKNFTDDNYPEGTNFDTYNNESIENYLDSIENNTLQYFIDENGILSIIVRLSIPVEMGYFDTVIKLEN